MLLCHYRSVTVIPWVDDPSGRRFLRFLGLTAFQAEGCGIALSGDEYEVSVTGLPFCHISHPKYGGESATSGGLPPPARAVVRFYTNWRRSRPPQPSQPQAVSNLRTLRASALSNLSREAAVNLPSMTSSWRVPAQGHDS